MHTVSECKYKSSSSTKSHIIKWIVHYSVSEIRFKSNVIKDDLKCSSEKEH